MSFSSQSVPVPVILLGASVQSMAGAAIAGGWKVWCCDFFHDADLKLRLRNSGNRLLEPLHSFKDAAHHTASVPREVPVVWGGGLENHIDVLDELSQQRMVLGSPLSSIRGVRDPARLFSLLQAAHLRVPSTLFADQKGQVLSSFGDTDFGDTDFGDTDRLNSSGGSPGKSSVQKPREPRWLVKPVASAGGQNIRRLRFSGLDDRLPTPVEFAQTDVRTSASGTYLQEEIPGVPMSATFLCDPNDSHSPRHMGSCLQLSGFRSLHATEFQHCGNLGPVPLPSSILRTLKTAACRIHAEFPLRGLFGIDFILYGGEPCFLEVNPRPTASHLHLDSLVPTSLIDLHIRACMGVPSRTDVLDAESHRRDFERFSCSLILYTAEDEQFSEAEVNELLMAGEAVSDIPGPATVSPRGTPLLSIQIRNGLMADPGRSFCFSRLPAFIRKRFDSVRLRTELEQLLTDFRTHCKSPGTVPATS